MSLRGSGWLWVVFLLPFWADQTEAKMSVVNSVHNLSLSGPGDIKALSEDRVCIFCHTPHNAQPDTPLWNKEFEPQNYTLETYTLYKSSTLNPQVVIKQPTGPTRLCLSCHDGTIALGKLRSSPDTELPFTSRYVRSNLGIDISDDHPVSFSYFDALPDEELHDTLPPELLFYGSGAVHCSTCHDAHDDSNGMFLAVDNRFSGLCTKCHDKSGWAATSHSLSGKMWNQAGANPWPHNLRHSPARQWLTVRENGCQNCHRPHSAGGAKRLLNTLSEEDNCFPCHNGNVAGKNIEAEFDKTSVHDVKANTIGQSASAHDPAESPLDGSRHVECADCHNPHASRPDLGNTQPPYLPGPLTLVNGIDQDGLLAEPAEYEYEICFKCHADTNQISPEVQRVENETNLRLKFDTTNPSYHPVLAAGRNSSVPSLPNVNYDPAMNGSSIIYCTDCHDSDDSPKIGGTGARGPHGSIYAPLLREQYKTADFTSDSLENYALCYRCHQRQSIVADESFQKKSFGATFSRGGHSGHLGDGAPCSACHDPHGVQGDGFTGDHTHLINFDTLIAAPAAGQTAPIFTDNGSGAGSCALVCHGKTHTPGYAGSDLNTVDSVYP